MGVKTSSRRTLGLLGNEVVYRTSGDPVGAELLKQGKVYSVHPNENVCFIVYRRNGKEKSAFNEKGAKNSF